MGQVGVGGELRWSYAGDIPFSASSLSARGFFERCVRPMPRNTFGALAIGLAAGAVVTQTVRDRASSGIDGY